MTHVGADILDLDFLQTKDGVYVLLESDDIPGFSDFPDAVRIALARRMRERLEAAPPA